MTQDLAVAKGPARRTRLGKPVIEQSAHFSNKACGPHGMHPSLNPGMQRRPVDGQTNLDGTRVVIGVRRERRHEGFAGQLDHLKGPHNPTRIGGQDLVCSGRVDLSQLFVQRQRPNLAQPSLPLGPQLSIGAGELKHVEDRAGVQR